MKVKQQLEYNNTEVRIEFKSTLRWNLHTCKPDKRMENACLKTAAAYLFCQKGR